MKRFVKKKNVANNVDILSYRAPWQKCKQDLDNRKCKLKCNVIDNHKIYRSHSDFACVCLF